MTRDIQLSIVGHLHQVAAERHRRECSPMLKAAVQAVKLYQQERFSLTYADLLTSSRYGKAAHFFLEELYGPRDFTRRDAQFSRVIPALVRLFPAEVTRTVDTLARLHAVSEQLDSEMGAHLAGVDVEAVTYTKAWQSTGHPDQREIQIALTLDVGAAMDRFTRKPLLRHTLRMMRGAANAAGLGELQRFLEAGFDAFKAMNGADDFLSFIARRERQFVQSLFAAEVPLGGHSDLPQNLRVASTDDHAG